MMPLGEQALMAILVIAALVLVLWLMQRKGTAQFVFSRSGAQKNLQVIERLHLTPQHSVHLVRIGERTLLLGVSPSGCTLLTDPGEDVSAAFRLKSVPQ
jgi:flagellar biosynthetic protein FliO